MVRSGRRVAAWPNAYRWVDPMGIALTGKDPNLLPMLCKVMVGGLVLAPGVGEAYSARDENGLLVGFLVFSLPGQLLFLSEKSRAQGYYDYVNMLAPEAKEFL
ncbi:uncharacterized protein PHACADRAFT_210891 [Phanerochaete carnosa HHB-10118-sp]|uniref:Uncharacterized protein n=1 Tax=Phanerochaete carnosa (strain HHB-10118-sp) TaxID=650164 RepID=K5W2P5_PHACS|nr:uncharacterized protein PHACADRAFT_210891 [Phanerochaete carnosa HHB-10118-sp]EKM53199.1 hypothetical protein PHACADRAFT_210891 [Phanerochaete carnosa HHB-10118-sp]